MRYLYGDSTPFPLDFDFLATLEAFMPPATLVVQLEHEARMQNRKNAEAQVSRQKALGAVEGLHAKIVSAIQAAALEIEHQAGLDMARQLIDDAGRLVDEHRRTVERQNAMDEAQKDADAERRVRDVRAQLEVFFRVARLPTTHKRVSMELSEGRNDLTAVVQHPGGILTSFVLGTGTAPAWRAPRKVADFARGMDLMVGVKKSFFKGTVSADQMHLDDWIVGSFDVSDDHGTIALRKKADQKDTLVFKLRRDSDAFVGEVEHPGDPNADALPSSLSPSDVTQLRHLWGGLLESTEELFSHREAVRSVSLDGADIFKNGSPLALVIRLVEMFAPTVRTIAQKSPNEHELSLKIEHDGGRREEIYLKRDELLAKLQPLGSTGREVFAPLGLDTWVPSTTLRPPPVVRVPERVPEVRTSDTTEISVEVVADKPFFPPDNVPRKPTPPPLRKKEKLPETE